MSGFPNPVRSSWFQSVWWVVVAVVGAVFGISEATFLVFIAISVAWLMVASISEAIARAADLAHFDRCTDRAIDINARVRAAVSEIDRQRLEDARNARSGR